MRHRGARVAPLSYGPIEDFTARTLAELVFSLCGECAFLRRAVKGEEPTRARDRRKIEPIDEHYQQCKLALTELCGMMALRVVGHGIPIEGERLRECRS